MNVLDQFAFAVALHELERDGEIARHVVKAALDIVERLSTVHGGLTNAEQIEVRTVDDRDPHDFFKPSSQALNCWMSSLNPALSPAPASASAAATSCCACSEKN